jgi:hypothetical protein
MNRSTFNTAHYVLFAIAMLSFFCACSPQAENEAKAFPANGSVCLQSENSKAGFIRMEFKNGQVEGMLLMEEEVNGKVYYAFKGQLMSDSILRVLIEYPENSVTQDWPAQISGDRVVLRNVLNRKEMSSYLMVDCAALPAISDYSSLAEIERDEAAEERENTPSLCFECAYPGGNKRIVFREYIQLSNNNGKVNGRGAGYSEGDPEWAFYFSGTLKDSILELKADYRQDGVNPFSTTETWIVDFEKGMIHLDNQVPAGLRTISNGEYHKVECDYIPENLRILMNSRSEQN